MDDTTENTYQVDYQSMGPFVAGTVGALAAVGALYAYWQYRQRDDSKIELSLGGRHLGMIDLPGVDLRLGEKDLRKQFDQASEEGAKNLSSLLERIREAVQDYGESMRRQAPEVVSQLRRRAANLDDVREQATRSGAELGDTLGQVASQAGENLAQARARLGSSLQGAGTAVGHTVSGAGASVGHAMGNVGHAVGSVGGATKSAMSTSTKLAMWGAIIGSALLYVYYPDPKERDRLVAKARKYFDEARGAIERLREEYDEIA